MAHAPPPSLDAARDTAAAARARGWRFVRFGLVSTLAAGSLLGAIALLVDEPLAPILIQGHAFAQLFGFVLPIAIGMALRLLPPPPWPTARVEGAVFWAVVAGSTSRFGAYLAAGLGGRGLVAPLAIAGTLALDAAAALFLVTIVAGLLRRRPIAVPDRLAFAALFFLALSVALDAADGVELARSGGVRRVHAELVHAAFLDGFAATLTAALLARMGRGLTGGGAPLARLAPLVPLGTLAMLAAPFLPSDLARFAASGGALAWSIGAATVASPLLVRRTRPADPRAAWLTRAALVWLVAAALIRGYAALELAAKGFVSNGLLADASRHAFALGFLTQLMIAVLGRYARASGAEDPQRALAWAGGALLELAVALRVARPAAIYLPPAALDAVAISGALAWVALALLAAPLVRTPLR
jgi:hypothetical protein